MEGCFTSIKREIYHQSDTNNISKIVEREKLMNMLTVNELWIVMISLLVLKLCHSIYQWRNPKCNGNLPPGSMGFPIIGETFQFKKQTS